MWTLKRFEDELLAGPMTWKHVWSEVRELAEAAREGSLPNVVEEWNDVVLCWQLLLMRWLPIKWLPIVSGTGLPSVVKFEARHGTWHEIFRHHNAGEFRKEYYLGGSNYRKRHKVARVLARSGYEGAVDWDWVESRVGGFEV